MFSGWRGVHRASSAIAGFSAVLGEDGLSVRTYTENFFSSHLDEAGEPWGATRGPQGRINPFPTPEIWMRDPMAVGPVRRLPTPSLRSPGSAPWLPGFV